MGIAELDSDFTDFFSCVTNWQKSGIGSDNGLAHIRGQAIIWTNNGLIYWRIYASLGLNDQVGKLYSGVVEI